MKKRERAGGGGRGRGGREREREREIQQGRTCVRARMRACVRACVRACMGEDGRADARETPFLHLPLPLLAHILVIGPTVVKQQQSPGP